MKKIPQLPPASEGGAVVLYARYSSGKQTEQSVEGQLRFCREYAARRGFSVVNEYVDRAISGTDAGRRPQFQQMIADAASGKFRFIIVWKLDRFARNRYDSVIYKHKLAKYGVKVLSATEGVGEGDESIILEAILEAAAESFSHQLSQNVRRGMAETALKGNSTGGTIPVGYRVENKKLVIDEREAEIIRSAFTRYAAGDGKQKIVDDLTARGFRKRNGKPFDFQSFSRILTNKKYIGVYHYNGAELEGGCPAIVSPELFEKAAAKAAAAKRAPAHGRENAAEYQLQGKLFCGPCGSTMIGESGRSSGGATYNYYSCSKRKKHHTCKKKNEKKDFLEFYAVEQACEYVLAPDRLDFIADRVVDTYNAEFDDSAIETLEKRLKAIGRKFDELTASLIRTANQIMIDRINEQADALEKEKADAEADLAGLKIGNKAKLTPEDVTKFLRQYCKGDPCDMDFRRRMIDTFINSVFLYDDKVVIYFNVKGSEQVSYIEMLADTEEPGATAPGSPQCSTLNEVGDP